jgi:hypothetical protein
MLQHANPICNKGIAGNSEKFSVGKRASGNHRKAAEYFCGYFSGQPIRAGVPAEHPISTSQDVRSPHSEGN